MRNVDPRRARWIKVRLFILVTLLALGLCRLGAEAYDLQVRRAPFLKDAAEQQYMRDVEIQPRRGTIYDRHHNALAVTVDVPSLLADPRKLRRVQAGSQALAARMAGILSIPLAELERDLATDSAYRWIKHFLSPAEVDGMRALMREFHIRDGEGFEIIKEPRRWYPNRELGAHVMGFVGADGHGLEGIEKALDEHLRGRPLNLQGVRDAKGRLIFAEGLTPADGGSGHDVVLTLDKTIQYIAETELGNTVRAFEANGGSIVVTDPHTGEVLAMASYPTYNPNEFWFSAPDARRNRAITDRFEPGSTMKVFTVGGALDLGVISPGQLINCYNGEWQIGDMTIHDDHPAAMATPMQVLAISNNIGAAQIGLSLGADRLERVFRRFGFGERTGLPLPGEARARFGGRRWYEPEVATVSFGQAIGVTNAQLAQGLGAIANDGHLMPPLLVTSIHDATGGLVEEHAPDNSHTAMQPRVARLLAEMLTAVTEEGGTGVDAAIPGISVAGKTGTAQKANEHGRGYDKDRWVSSFIGFVPADKPSLVITVVIDEPRVVHWGGAVAAPLFRRVAEQSLRYMGRLPSGAAAPRPSRNNASAVPTQPQASDQAPQIEISGGGGQPTTTRVNTQVPSVVGLTLRQAVGTLASAGLTGIAVGSGTVISQRPSAGQQASSDGRVILELEPGGGAPRPQPVEDVAPAPTPAAAPARGH